MLSPIPHLAGDGGDFCPEKNNWYNSTESKQWTCSPHVGCPARKLGAQQVDTDVS